MGAPMNFVDEFAMLDSVSIGLRIRTLRKLRGLTQVQLAKQLGIDQSTLSDIERGASFSASILVALADSLRTTPHYIMRDGDESVLQESELIYCFRALSDSGRESLLQVARGLLATTPATATNPYPTRSSKST